MDAQPVLSDWSIYTKHRYQFSKYEVKVNHFIIYLIVPLGFHVIPNLKHHHTWNKWIYDQPIAIIPTYTFTVYFYFWINWIVKSDEYGELILVFK